MQETEDVLAQYLADNAYESKPLWKSRIDRAHRGKSTVIHCQFSTWKGAEALRTLFMKSGGKIGAVYHVL